MITSCPVRFTCPLIDSVIEGLEYAEKQMQEALDDWDSLSPNEVKEKLENAMSQLEPHHGNYRSTLEEIRSANAKLRDWGEGLEQRIEELESAE